MVRARQDPLLVNCPHLAHNHVLSKVVNRTTVGVSWRLCKMRHHRQRSGGKHIYILTHSPSRSGSLTLRMAPKGDGVASAGFKLSIRNVGSRHAVGTLQAGLTSVVPGSRISRNRPFRGPRRQARAQACQHPPCRSQFTGTGNALLAYTVHAAQNGRRLDEGRHEGQPAGKPKGNPMPISSHHGFDIARADVGTAPVKPSRAYRPPQCPTH